MGLKSALLVQKVPFWSVTISGALLRRRVLSLMHRTTWTLGLIGDAFGPCGVQDSGAREMMSALGSSIVGMTGKVMADAPASIFLAWSFHLDTAYPVVVCPQFFE